MKIRNLRSFAVSIPVEGGEIYVGAGDEADVPDDLGASLVEQVDAWQEAGDGRQSVQDVLDHVGDDPDRARAALAIEQQDSKPRKTLVSRLEEIAASSEENV